MTETSARFERTLVTAALPYANGEIHLGHLAGAYLPADIYARYLRLRGRPVLFICGTDEYGVPITLAAERQGVSPKELVDRNYVSIRASFAGLGIEFDNFSQTSRPIHAETSQSFFRDLHAQGRLKQKTTQQFYSPSQQRFLADRYIEGTCPHCERDGARGDQCETCGRSLNPTDLIDPHDALKGEPLELRETTHWFLPLGDWQPQLESFIGAHPEWKENVLQFCRAWFKDGLDDRAVTRDIDWGVPVPLPDHAGKVLYVWFDAPIGYISSTREWAIEQGDPEAWRVWWQDPTTRLVHFIGKDNVVFHALMFPAMLLAHSEPFILPDNVPANEFLNLEGRKLSTSRGFAVWLPDYLAKFKPDPLRYAMARNLPETRDMNFTWEGFLARNDNELGNNFGNLFNRVLTFIHKYFDGAVPAWSPDELQDADRAVLAEVAALRDRWAEHLERFEIKAAMECAFAAGQAGNRYFDEAAPFNTRKTDLARCGQSLGVSVQIVRQLCAMLAPVVPFGMARLWGWLGMETPLFHGGWDEALRDVPAGRPLGRPEILFPRLDPEAIEAEVARLQRLVEDRPA
ncbi:MAG TPA: methionine--tRNA ligase [Candidatus Krumholzibacteria bacterium]|nr:methionine--tRNA ligase [Candidatus Krumholzibacteria bacterium]HPD72092.1 methionine--tRNA ligase [Candidatus Krumholzibacteria bacterium]HRY40976.1 methionine--tRNA ligase [Candidatus Krumholzibacteria bacterium]